MISLGDSRRFVSRWLEAFATNRDHQEGCHRRHRQEDPHLARGFCVQCIRRSVGWRAALGRPRLVSVSVTSVSRMVISWVLTPVCAPQAQVRLTWLSRHGDHQSNKHAHFRVGNWRLPGRTADWGDTSLAILAPVLLCCDWYEEPLNAKIHVIPSELANNITFDTGIRLLNKAPGTEEGMVRLAAFVETRPHAEWLGTNAGGSFVVSTIDRCPRRKYHSLLTVREPGVGQAERDRAYHQGTVWPWLLETYAHAVEAIDGPSAAAEEMMPVLAALCAHLRTEGCIGQIGEVFDGDAPHRPGGAPAQAWSVSEVLRVARMAGL